MTRKNIGVMIAILAILLLTGFQCSPPAADGGDQNRPPTTGQAPAAPTKPQAPAGVTRGDFNDAVSRLDRDISELRQNIADIRKEAGDQAESVRRALVELSTKVDNLKAPQSGLTTADLKPLQDDLAALRRDVNLVRSQVSQVATAQAAITATLSAPVTVTRATTVVVTATPAQATPTATPGPGAPTATLQPSPTATTRPASPTTAPATTPSGQPAVQPTPTATPTATPTQAPIVPAAPTVAPTSAPPVLITQTVVQTVTVLITNTVVVTQVAQAPQTPMPTATAAQPTPTATTRPASPTTAPATTPSGQPTAQATPGSVTSTSTWTREEKCAWLRTNFPQTTEAVQALGVQLAGGNIPLTRVRSHSYTCNVAGDGVMDGLIVLGPREGFDGLVKINVPAYGAIDAYQPSGCGPITYSHTPRKVAGNRPNPCDDTWRADQGSVTALSLTYWPFNDENPPLGRVIIAGQPAPTTTSVTTVDCSKMPAQLASEKGWQVTDMAADPKYGGIRVRVFPGIANPDYYLLPPKWESVTSGKKILQDDADRTMIPEYWTVYGPFDCRAAWGVTS